MPYPLPPPAGSCRLAAPERRWLELRPPGVARQRDSSREPWPIVGDAPERCHVSPLIHPLSSTSAAVAPPQDSLDPSPFLLCTEEWWRHKNGERWWSPHLPVGKTPSPGLLQSLCCLCHCWGCLKFRMRSPNTSEQGHRTHKH
jgi:hypothetical protein